MRRLLLLLLCLLPTWVLAAPWPELRAQLRTDKNSAAKTLVGMLSGDEGAQAAYLLGTLAYEDQDFAEAARYFGSVKSGALAPDALFFEAESLFWSHDREAAGDRFAQIPADSMYRPWAQLRLADVRFSLGDYKIAAELYKAFWVKYPSYPYRDAIFFALAECKQRFGDSEGAAQAYLDLWMQYPHSPYASRAWKIRQELSKEAPSPLERLARARELFAVRFYARSLAELDLLRKDIISLNFSGDAALIASIDLERGKALLRMGKAEEAASVLAPLKDSSKEAQKYLADALGISGKSEEAANVFADYLDRRPDSKPSRTYADFLFDFGRYKEAKVEYKRLPASADFVFRIVWCDYRLGNFAAAEKGFVQLAKKYSEYKPIAAYWLLRLKEKQGKKNEAFAGYRAMVEDDPTEYYSVMAASRLLAAGAAFERQPAKAAKDRTLPSETEVEDAFARLRKGFPTSSESLQRAYAFYQIGLVGNAREELETFYRSTKGESGVRSRSPFFPANWVKQGSFRPEEVVSVLVTADSSEEVVAESTLDATKKSKSRKAAPAKKKLALPEGWLSDVGVAFAGLEDAHYPMYLWPEKGALRYFPRAYQDEVRTVASEFSHMPEELWALMHTESLFHRFVASHVGAIGLMQIMPKTGRLIASHLAFDDFRPGLLFDATTNLRYGAWYYERLKEVFQGQLPLAMAAYNGGPYMVGRIVRGKAWTSPELDEILEEIPPRESRMYAKKVLGKVAHYQRLYEGIEKVTVSMKLNTEVGSQVDF